jgi:hypothetical protein
VVRFDAGFGNNDHASSAWSLTQASVGEKQARSVASNGPWPSRYGTSRARLNARGRRVCTRIGALLLWRERAVSRRTRGCGIRAGLHDRPARRSVIIASQMQNSNAAGVNEQAIRSPVSLQRVPRRRIARHATRACVDRKFHGRAITAPIALPLVSVTGSSGTPRGRAAAPHRV